MFHISHIACLSSFSSLTLFSTARSISLRYLSICSAVLFPFSHAPILSLSRILALENKFINFLPHNRQIDHLSRLIKEPLDTITTCHRT